MTPACASDCCDRVHGHEGHWLVSVHVRARIIKNMQASSYWRVKSKHNSPYPEEWQWASSHVRKIDQLHLPTQQGVQTLWCETGDSASAIRRSEYEVLKRTATEILIKSIISGDNQHSPSHAWRIGFVIGYWVNVRPEFLDNDRVLDTDGMALASTWSNVMTCCMG